MGESESIEMGEGEASAMEMGEGELVEMGEGELGEKFRRWRWVRSEKFRRWVKNFEDGDEASEMREQIEK